MFQLIIELSRYAFIFYILYFLWQGVVYLLHERGVKPDRPRASAKQRACVVLFHVSAYAILAYQPGQYMFDTQILFTGAIGLGFLTGSFLVASLFFSRTCPLIWNGMFFLLDIGFVMLQRLNADTAQKQVIYACIGALAALLAALAFIIVSRFEKMEYAYLAISFLLLILPFFIGDRTNGSLNWVTVGAITFQPSEIAKFFYVFFLASDLYKQKTMVKLIPSAAAAFCFMLILTFQNDLGGALIFFLTYLIMVYIATGKLRLFFAGLAAASVGSVIAYHFVAHVQTRVSVWLNPWADPFDKGLQILQSLFAIGTWGLLGSGLTRGIPEVVPVAASDFIFSAICEEFGGLFGLCMIGIFFMVFYRGVNVALRSESPYLSLLAIGFTGMFVLQTFLIIGGVTKFIPMTGVTLPFVSAGGSSVVISMAMISILQMIGIAKHKSGGSFISRAGSVTAGEL